MATAVKNAWRTRGILSTLRKATSRTYFTYTNEISMPIKDKEPKWVEKECAFECLKSDQVVFAQGAAATPSTLLTAMAEHGKKEKLKNIKVIHIHTEGKAAYTAPECEGIFRSVSTFMGANVRKAVNEGRGDSIPIFLQDIPLLFTRKIYKPDISVIQVSPPDSHGFCSLGTSVDCVRAGVTHSKIIIAQVNKHMPRTFGDAIIHISHIDYAVKVEEKLPEHGGVPPNEVESKIGKLIAENLVDDGATLQMGIGSIPEAVLSALKNHKDLGVHSEMFSDGVVDLVHSGVVTNNKKPITHRGRIVGSFLNGTQKLYSFVDNNPFVEMKVVDYVNNSRIISQQHKMTAINSCLEIDLSGQACADSIGTRMYSGFGGQVDFIRGAAEAEDGLGKPILAMPSVTKKGISKIAPTLIPGAGVVTTRAHIHYVVTEHGIADLFGKTLRQRAHALICIADPCHREELEKAAFHHLKCMPSAD